uniref:Uncharacterized protein n=1 Tax=Ditylenchus dipsaci TaxID=166011 RepID=A0A915DVZ7_9BILA
MYWKRGYDYNDWLVVKNADNKEESAVVDKKKSYAMVTVWDTSMHVIGRYREGSFIDFKCNSDLNKWMPAESLQLDSPHFPYFMDFSLANIKKGWDSYTPQRFLNIECIYQIRFDGNYYNFYLDVWKNSKPARTTR